MTGQVNRVYTDAWAQKYAFIVNLFQIDCIFLPSTDAYVDNGNFVHSFVVDLIHKFDCTGTRNYFQDLRTLR